MAIEQGKIVAAVSSAGKSLVAANGQPNTRALRLFSPQEGVMRDGPYKDSAVIREGNLIIARQPVNLLAFCRMLMAALAAPCAAPVMPAEVG